MNIKEKIVNRIDNYGRVFFLVKQSLGKGRKSIGAGYYILKKTKTGKTNCFFIGCSFNKRGHMIPAKGSLVKVGAVNNLLNKVYESKQDAVQLLDWNKYDKFISNYRNL